MSRRHTPYYLAALVSLLTFAIYLPALGNGFVNWDDNINAYDNFAIRSLDRDFFRWAFSDVNTANYWHPVTWISHAVDYAVWGLNPMGHHLTNNILHALNTFIVVMLLVRLLEFGKGSTGTSLQLTTHDSRFTIRDSPFTVLAAGTTGLLFGLHPLHVESVAWISERKDLLCALFFLLSILAYIRYACGIGPIWPPREGRLGSTNMWYLNRKYLLSLALFTLALASKPMAITLPFVLLLLDWYPFKRIISLKDLYSAFLEKLPFIAFSFIVSLVAFWGQRELRVMNPLENVPLTIRLLTAAGSPIVYLWKMAIPLNLNPVYPYPKSISFLSVKYLSATALLIGVTAGCIFMAKKQRILLVAWGYYILTLLPVLGIIQVGIQSMADRFTYIPGIGPFLLVGLSAAWVWGEADSSKKWGSITKLITASIAISIVFSLSYLSIKQIAIWKNSIDFWTYIIKKEPVRVPVAYNNRAAAFKESGQLDRAIEDYTRAIGLGYVPATAYNNRGLAYMESGQPGLAIADFDTARTLAPGSPATYNNRGLAFVKTGEIDCAVADFNKAIILDPDYADAYTSRGWVLKEMGQLDQAIEDFNKAITLDHWQHIAYVNRGLIFEQRGLTDNAMRDYKTACDMGSEEGCAALRAYKKR